jgi:hypothetical protein
LHDLVQAVFELRQEVAFLLLAIVHWSQWGPHGAWCMVHGDSAVDFGTWLTTADWHVAFALPMLANTAYHNHAEVYI